MKYWLIAVLAASCLVILIVRPAYSRDLDGKYAQSPLKGWFDSLHSNKGMCCSYADGRTITDADWEMADNHYRVKVDGVWYDVPEAALVTVPNKFGQAVVWPFKDQTGQTQIRCFMPGAGT